MRKITIQIAKGGTGKTTTAVNLAAGLAGRYKILLIDTDTQAQCSKMLGVNPAVGLAELLEGNVKPIDALIEARPNLWLLAGSLGLGAAKRLIARKEFKSEAVLSEALGAYEGLFDFVILDTSPGWDSLSVNVLFYADEILSPVSLEALSVDGFLSFLKSMDPIKKYRDVDIKYVLPTFLDGRVKKSQEILNQLNNYFGDKLCDPIRYSAKLSEAPGHGKTIFEYAPRDRGAVDYTKLTGRVLRNG